MRILITGAAGFIGFHAAQEFLRRGWDVVGLDNFNDYYSINLKRDRAGRLASGSSCAPVRDLDICDLAELQVLFADESPDVVLHLAAQPGVRYSITHPFIYQKTNVEGFLNVLECCRHAAKTPKLVFASSSSVYGGNKKMPFEESDPLTFEGTTLIVEGIHNLSSQLVSHILTATLAGKANHVLH